MTEDELIETVAAALWKQEAASVPGTHARRTPGAFQDQATEWREKWLGMARCALAAVRSHDAARVPADAELDGLVAWLSSRQTCTGFASPEPHVLETVYAPCEKSQSAADAITALRRRVAELEAIGLGLVNEYPVSAFGTGRADEPGYGHIKAMADALGLKSAREARARSDAQEGRADV